MLAESHSDQLAAAGEQINYSAFFGGVFTGYIYGEALQLPNMCGTVNSESACGSFPYGLNGGVSTHNGQGNFAFADGHVKSMTPPQTVPNPASGITGASWWDWGQFDTGQSTGKPSLWEADHQ
jgi:prepilin-type processing-associated H-X9-DG protein